MDGLMDEMPREGFRHQPLWLLAVAGLVLAQAGLVLSLLGAERSFGIVTDDRPILSGRHPLHLYHGTLGAHSFRDTGSTNCYDPYFQAGYPKTPVFDGGCRPAELFLALAGGRYSPAAYKTGLLTCLLLVPLAFVLAGRGAGLPAPAAVLAGALGMFVGWSGPVRRLIEEGELDFLMAGLAVIVFVAWLGRNARWFGIDSWLVLSVAAIAGWYAHPVVWMGLAPVLVGYYLAYAPQQEPAWHLGLLGTLTAGLATNMWWLADWGRYWWLRQPSRCDDGTLPGWQSALGRPGDYLSFVGHVPCGVVVVGLGAAGLVGLWRCGHRGSVVLLGSVVVLVVGAARTLAAWPRVPSDGPESLAPLAIGLLALPAAFAVWKALERGRIGTIGPIAVVVAFAAVGWADGTERPLARFLHLRTEPLRVGLSSEQQEVIAAIQTHTTPEARILWDETTDHRPGWNWTALLPVFTDRAYLGGLDHDAGMEYSFCGMREGKLNGRSLADWSDAELEQFCKWYNVGWVVCRSGAAVERWGRVPMANPVARLSENGRTLVVFALDRRRSFVLSGQATWESATPTRITLTNVAPDADGFVKLSLHYQEGLRVYPSFVEPLPAKDSSDPISHIRLRPHGPVPRVTLVWTSR
jgi:hypothetical protein